MNTRYNFWWHHDSKLTLQEDWVRPLTATTIATVSPSKRRRAESVAGKSLECGFDIPVGWCSPVSSRSVHSAPSVIHHGERSLVEARQGLLFYPSEQVGGGHFGCPRPEETDGVPGEHRCLTARHSELVERVPETYVSLCPREIQRRQEDYSARVDDYGQPLSDCPQGSETFLLRQEAYRRHNRDEYNMRLSEDLDRADIIEPATTLMPPSPPLPPWICDHPKTRSPIYPARHPVQYHPLLMPPGRQSANGIPPYYRAPVEVAYSSEAAKFNIESDPLLPFKECQSEPSQLKAPPLSFVGSRTILPSLDPPPMVVSSSATDSARRILWSLANTQRVLYDEWLNHDKKIRDFQATMCDLYKSKDSILHQLEAVMLETHEATRAVINMLQYSTLPPFSCCDHQRTGQGYRSCSEGEGDDEEEEAQDEDEAPDDDDEDEADEGDQKQDHFFVTAKLANSPPEDQENYSRQDKAWTNASFYPAETLLAPTTDSGPPWPESFEKSQVHKASNDDNKAFTQFHIGCKGKDVSFTKQSAAASTPN